MFVNRFIKDIRSRLRPNLQQDRNLLLLCMIASLVFWFLVKLSANYTTVKTLHPQYEISENLAFLNMPPDHINATIRGRGWDLMYEYFANFEPDILIDVNNEDITTLGQTRLINAVEDVLTSSQIQVLRLDINQIPLDTEERDEKTIPILLLLDLETKDGYHQMDSITLKPDSVIISGPASLVDSLDEWETLELKLVDLQQTTTTTAKLHPSPWSGLALSQEEIEVTIPIEQLTEKSLFIDVLVKNAPDSLKIFPDKIRINAIVGLKDYNAIVQDDFQAEVDLAGVELNTTENTAPIIITRQPEVVKSIYFTPKSVEFFIVKDTE